MITSIVILSAIGLLLSLYAFFVERQLRNNKTYKAACDISDNISCTKPLLSPYANIVGISNAVLGLLFYAILLLCAWYDYTQLVRYGALAAALASVIFAYILYFKIHSLCLICSSIYVVNMMLVFCAYIMK